MLTNMTPTRPSASSFYKQNGNLLSLSDHQQPAGEPSELISADMEKAVVKSKSKLSAKETIGPLYSSVRDQQTKEQHASKKSIPKSAAEQFKPASQMYPLPKGVVSLEKRDDILREGSVYSAAETDTPPSEAQIVAETAVQVVEAKHEPKEKSEDTSASTSGPSADLSPLDLAHFLQLDPVIYPSFAASMHNSVGAEAAKYSSVLIVADLLCTLIRTGLPFKIAAEAVRRAIAVTNLSLDNTSAPPWVRSVLLESLSHPYSNPAIDIAKLLHGVGSVSPHPRHIGRRLVSKPWVSIFVPSPTSGSSDRPINVRGLPNFGQTCFLNSVLQSLASLDPFCAYLHRIVELQDRRREFDTTLKNYSKEDTTTLSEDLLHALILLNGREQIHDDIMNNEGIQRFNLPDPLLLLRRIGTKNAQFRGRGTTEQHDAQELLQALLTMIITESDSYLPVISSIGTTSQQNNEDENRIYAVGSSSLSSSDSLATTATTMPLTTSTLETTDPNVLPSSPLLRQAPTSSVDSSVVSLLSTSAVDDDANSDNVDGSHMEGDESGEYDESEEYDDVLTLSSFLQMYDKEDRKQKKQKSKACIASDLESEQQDPRVSSEIENVEFPDESPTVQFDDPIIREDLNMRNESASAYYCRREEKKQEDYQLGIENNIGEYEHDKQGWGDAQRASSKENESSTIVYDEFHHTEKSKGNVIYNTNSASSSSSNSSVGTTSGARGPLTPTQRMLQSLSPITPSPMSGWMGSRLQCGTCRHVRPIQNAPFLAVPIVPTSISSFQDQLCLSWHSPFGRCLTQPSASTRSPSQSCELNECLSDFTSIERVEDVECRSCAVAAVLHELEEEVATLRGAVDTMKKKKGKLEEKNMQGLLRELDQAESKYLDWIGVDPDGDEDLDDLLVGDNKEDLMILKEQIAPSVRGEADKRLLFTRLPTILCLHVQRRFYDPTCNRMVKAGQHVDFPEILDLDPHCIYGTSRVVANINAGKRGKATDSNIAFSHAGSSSGPILYRLMSVIEHRGDAYRGHYQTFRRVVAPSNPAAPNQTNHLHKEWAYISDQTVEYVDWSRVRQCQAYMLFYEAI